MMHNRKFLNVGSALLILSVFVSCQSTPTVASPVESGIGVGISDNECPTVVVQAGRQITWTNQGKQEHIVRDRTIEGQSQFDSGILQPRDSFTFTFSQLQSYQYECSADGSLTGTITVQP